LGSSTFFGGGFGNLFEPFDLNLQLDVLAMNGLLLADGLFVLSDFFLQVIKLTRRLNNHGSQGFIVRFHLD
jgi:hypothetical protein